MDLSLLNDKVSSHHKNTKSKNTQVLKIESMRTITMWNINYCQHRYH